MRIFVDELPKSCRECVCWDENLGCNIGDFNKKACPLQSITDYTKQVRKEVCEEIKSAIKEKLVYPDNRVDCPFSDGFAFEDTICDVIDQIQGDRQ